MLDYYTLQRTLEMLKESPNDEYTAQDLAILCRQGILTPVFAYNRYCMEILEYYYDSGKPEQPSIGRRPEPMTKHFHDGYLTDKRLLSLLDESEDKLELFSVMTYERDGSGCEIALVTNDGYTVTRESLLFPSEQVQSYVASKQTNEQNTPEQQEIAKLKKKIADLQKQLEERNDTPAGIKPLKGLYKHNADKALFITTGQELAKYIWSMDTEQAIRTGDMVQQLKQVMNSIDNNLLPDDKAIREWLSGIAPDYAKKSGKPPKDAPREISLIMRK